MNLLINLILIVFKLNKMNHLIIKLDQSKMFKKLNPRHNEFLINIIDEKTSRINILKGYVRSGKTYMCLIAWLILVFLYLKNSNFLMVGKTITSLKGNCLTLLASLCNAFVFSTSKKETFFFSKKFSWIRILPTIKLMKALF